MTQVDTLTEKTILSNYLDISNPVFVLDFNWSSANPDNRKLLRQYIYEHIDRNPDILDLAKIPKLPQGSVSISHSRTWGGFIYTSTQLQIGFDTEINERLNINNISRVSLSREEVISSPSPCALWTAKEAAFKSLLTSSEQPLVSKDIEIGQWKKLENNIYSCKGISVSGEKISGLYGICFIKDNDTLSFFRRTI